MLQDFQLGVEAHDLLPTEERGGGLEKEKSRGVSALTVLQPPPEGRTGRASEDQIPASQKHGGSLVTSTGKTFNSRENTEGCSHLEGTQPLKMLVFTRV